LSDESEPLPGWVPFGGFRKIQVRRHMSPGDGRLSWSYVALQSTDLMDR
jgi:hypothetical protein